MPQHSIEGVLEQNTSAGSPKKPVKVPVADMSARMLLLTLPSPRLVPLFIFSDAAVLHGHGESKEGVGLPIDAARERSWTALQIAGLMAKGH